MNWPGEFTAPVIPPGACPDGCSTTEPYKPEPPSQASLEFAQQQADGIAARAEAERQQHAREHEELLVKEAAVRYAAEALLELKQREKEEATAQAVGSVVLAGTAITVQGPMRRW